MLGQFNRTEVDGKEVIPNPDDAGFYLDCYCYGAAAGDKRPVATYGPATFKDIQRYGDSMKRYFDRTEIVTETKGREQLTENL